MYGILGLHVTCLSPIDPSGQEMIQKNQRILLQEFHLSCNTKVSRYDILLYMILFCLIKLFHLLLLYQNHTSYLFKYKR